jgi:hypothetical protein
MKKFKYLASGFAARDKRFFLLCRQYPDWLWDPPILSIAHWGLLLLGVK